MKTKVASLLVVLFISTISCTAQRRITVEAQNSDISNNLDLQAVASTFGESKDLEDFERRLNDYDSQISNLDLNNDGEVDYLRVIENMEKLQYTTEEFTDICNVLDILHIQQELLELMQQAKEDTKQELNKIQLTKNANNNYNKSFYNNVEIFNKQI